MMSKKLYTLIVANWKTTSVGLAAGLLYFFGIAETADEFKQLLPDLIFSIGLIIFGALVKDPGSGQPSE
jgi:hypothetical protein